MANLLLLLQQWRVMLYFNKHISVLFLLYQGLLLVSSLIAPAVCILIVVGKIYSQTPPGRLHVRFQAGCGLSGRLVAVR